MRRPSIIDIARGLAAASVPTHTYFASSKRGRERGNDTVIIYTPPACAEAPREETGECGHRQGTLFHVKRVRGGLSLHVGLGHKHTNTMFHVKRSSEGKRPLAGWDARNSGLMSAGG
jgi:hypothetical protein